MIILVKRPFVLAFLSIFMVSHLLLGADDWQIIKVNGHDYLTVENIAKFYGLTANVVPSGEKIRIALHRGLDELFETEAALAHRRNTVTQKDHHSENVRTDFHRQNPRKAVWF